MGLITGTASMGATAGVLYCRPELYTTATGREVKANVSVIMTDDPALLRVMCDGVYIGSVRHMGDNSWMAIGAFVFKAEDIPNMSGAPTVGSLDGGGPHRPPYNNEASRDEAIKELVLAWVNQLARRISRFLRDRNLQNGGTLDE